MARREMRRGFGMLPEMLAMTLFCIGFGGKLMSEVIEGTAKGAVEAIRATGAGHLQTFVYAVLPQVRVAWVVGIVMVVELFSTWVRGRNRARRLEATTRGPSSLTRSSATAIIPRHERSLRLAGAPRWRSIDSMRCRHLPAAGSSSTAFCTAR